MPASFCGARLVDVDGPEAEAVEQAVGLKVGLQLLVDLHASAYRTAATLLDTGAGVVFWPVAHEACLLLTDAIRKIDASPAPLLAWRGMVANMLARAEGQARQANYRDEAAALATARGAFEESEGKPE